MITLMVQGAGDPEEGYNLLCQKAQTEYKFTWEKRDKDSYSTKIAEQVRLGKIRGERGEEWGGKGAEGLKEDIGETQ